MRVQVTIDIKDAAGHVGNQNSDKWLYGTDGSQNNTLDLVVDNNKIHLVFDGHACYLGDSGLPLTTHQQNVVLNNKFFLNFKAQTTTALEARVTRLPTAARPTKPDLRSKATPGIAHPRPPSNPNRVRNPNDSLDFLFESSLLIKHIEPKNRHFLEDQSK